MRVLVLLCCALGLISMPACSLLFDGSGYRSGGGGSDAGRDVGPPASCTDPADCEAAGLWCNLGSGLCEVGCDEAFDCGPAGCDLALHTCRPDVACTDDPSCGPGAYCDGTTCVACDGDGDGWAPDAAPARCLAAPGVFGPGDCDPVDPDVHPFAPPDCDPSTHETCDVGVATLSPDLFELGLLGRGTTPEGAKPDTMNLVVLTPGDDYADLFVLYDDTSSGQPHYVVPFVAAGVPSVENGRTLDGFDPAPDLLLSTTISVTRDYTTSGSVLVSSADVLGPPDGSGPPGLSQYRARISTLGASAVAGSFRRSLAPRLPELSTVRGAIVATSPSSGDANLAFIESGADGGVAVSEMRFAGILTDHDQVVGSFPFPFVVGDVIYGRASSFGGLFVGPTQSRLVWWNGEVGGGEAFHEADAESTLRSAVASAAESGTGHGFSVAPVGGGMARLRVYGSCTPGGTCVSNSFDIPFDTGSLDPLIAADQIAGEAYLVVGRSNQGPGGLLVSLVDFRTSIFDPPTVTSVLLPIGNLVAIEDLDVSVAVVPDADHVELTIGYATSTPSEVSYGAFRLCAYPSP